MSDPTIDIANPIATLVAAFAGVWFAFQLERWQRRRDEESRRVATANRALYTIANMTSFLLTYRDGIMEPYRKKSDAWLNMPATMPDANYGLTKFDAEHLSFLLECAAPTYGALMLEEQRFHQLVTLIEERSKVILQDMFPRLAAARIGVGENRVESEIVEILGIDVVRKLKVMTEGLMKNVDSGIASLRVSHDELRAAMKSLYPKSKFVLIPFDWPVEPGDDKP